MSESDLLKSNEEVNDLVLVEEKNQEISALSEIDRLEQEYLAEYYKIQEKDKLAGKDFNRYAHDEMVQMQF